MLLKVLVLCLISQVFTAPWDQSDLSGSDDKPQFIERGFQVPQEEKVAEMPEEKQGINLWAELGLDFSDYDVDNPVGPISADSDYAQCLLKQHNYYRNGGGLNSLVWSDRLAELALQTSEWFINDECKDYHRTSFNSEHWIGENLFSIKAMPYFFGQGREMCENGKMAVDRWYQEIQYYTYPQGAPRKFGDCDDYAGFSSYGHFIQVMWKDTKEVGCSYAYCYNYQDIYMMPKIIVNCYYDYPILKKGTVFNDTVAETLNAWPENNKYGGLKMCQ